MTAQEGNNSESSTLSSSSSPILVGLDVKQTEGTTSPPAKSLPNNNEIPFIGRVGISPTLTWPFTKFESRCTECRGTDTVFPSIPLHNTNSPVAESSQELNVEPNNKDCEAPVSLSILIETGFESLTDTEPSETKGL